MPILDEDLDLVKNLFDISFYGPLAITQAFDPLLIKAKGMAVFITSESPRSLGISTSHSWVGVLNFDHTLHPELT